MAPLDGIFMINLTRVLAGPFCTQGLQYLGALMIKVERPVSGDDTRAFPPFVAGGHPTLAPQHRPDGRAAAVALAKAP